MAIQITSGSTAPLDTSAAESAKTSAPKSKTAVAAEAKAQLNTAIVSASIDVSIGAGNDSLTLMLKSAINGINDALAPEFGENAIQNAMGQDNSPEGTAGRIVSLSTAFYGAYKQQHPGEDDATTLKNFMATIRGGFEQGFGEASDILKGMQVLKGDIASNIDKTYELVQKGYAAFEAAQSAPKDTAAAKDTAAPKA